MILGARPAFCPGMDMRLCFDYAMLRLSKHVFHASLLQCIQPIRLYYGNKMKPELKSALFTATLAVVMAPAATAFAAEERRADTKAGQAETVKAEKSEVKKPAKRNSRMEERTDTPKVMLLRDWEELFGHKPMEEHNRMPMHEPVSGIGRQETMKPMQKHDMQEKH